MALPMKKENGALSFFIICMHYLEFTDIAASRERFLVDASRCFVHSTANTKCLKANRLLKHYIMFTTSIHHCKSRGLVAIFDRVL